MSGHKQATVYIGLEDYQRLLDGEVQQRAEIEQAPPPAAAVQYTHEVIYENMNWMTERQDHFDAMFSSYNDEIQRVEAAANAAIHQQQTRLLSEMNQLAGSLWTNTEQLLQKAQQQYLDQLNRVQNRVYQEMAVIEQHLADRNAQDEAKLAIAEQWLNASNDLYRMIDREYNHPFFLPGELERLSGQLVLAEQNLSLGLAEACIAATQQAFLGLSHARIRLEKEEMDWLILRQSAYEAVQSMHAEISQKREISAIDLDGSPIDQQLDVNYWSKGEWQALADEFLQVIQPLQLTEQPPTSEFLYYLVKQYLPELRARLADACFAARIEALNSQLRVNIADIVVQALSVQGFMLEGYAYEQNDWRDSFQANLTGLDQSTVTVQVVPSGTEIGQNELHILSGDQPLRNQREMRQRWDEVEDMLVLSGLSVGECQVVGGKRGIRNNQALSERVVSRKY